MAGEFHDTSAMTPHRQSDPPSQLSVSRVIPLWGLITALGLFALQAISLYYNQISQGEKLASLQSTVIQINAKLDSISTAQNKADLKDLEHDFKINAANQQITMLIARVTEIESASRRKGGK